MLMPRHLKFPTLSAAGYLAAFALTLRKMCLLTVTNTHIQTAPPSIIENDIYVACQCHVTAM